MRTGEVVPSADWQEEVCREVLGRPQEGQDILQFCKAVISYCGRYDQEVGNYFWRQNYLYILKKNIVLLWQRAQKRFKYKGTGIPV